MQTQEALSNSLFLRLGRALSVLLIVMAKWFHWASPLLMLILAPGAWTADVETYSVAKGQHYTQLPVPGIDPVLDSQGYRWRAVVRASGSHRVQSVAVRMPDSNERLLTERGMEWDVYQDSASQATLDAAFPGGNYRFQIRGATDGLVSPQLTLATTTYPKLARLLEPLALSAISGRSSFTLSWDFGLDGVEPNAIQVSVVSLTGGTVFRTADPGQAGALSGTATQVEIPRSVWNASLAPPGDPVLYQVQVTTYRTGGIETTAYPGAVGFAASYRTTTISALVIDAMGCGDVEHFDVLLGKNWHQAGDGAVQPEESNPYVFRTSARECATQSLMDVRVTLPGGASVALTPLGGGAFALESMFASGAALAERYPPGDYVFRFEGKQDGVRTVSLSLRSGELPAPRIKNWSELQAPDYSQAIEIKLVEDASRLSEYDMQLQVVDEAKTIVYQTGGWWETNSRTAGDSASIVIPQGSLNQEHVYEARLRLLRRDELDTASYPRASGLAGTFSETRFSIGSSNGLVFGETFGIVNPTELPEMMLGRKVDYAFDARSGVLPVSWSVTAGVLPPGLGLDPVSGDLLGIPAETGTFSFVVRAQDAASKVVAQTFTLKVTGQASPLTLLTTQLPAGIGELQYSGVLAAAGGVEPFRWRLAPGSAPLPRGLTLESEDGLITGIPEESGSFPLRLVVSDHLGQSSEAGLSLVIPTFEPTPKLKIMEYRQRGDRLSLRLEGIEDQAYTLEHSNDLVSWLPLVSTNRLPAGEWSFQAPPSATAQFFRIQAGSIPPPLFPRSIHAIVAPSQSARAILSSTNQVLSLTNKQGIVFTLVLPPEALRRPIEIGMTSIESIPDLPLSGGMLAAVSMEPEGLVLRQPGTLTIRFPVALPAGAIAFGAQGLGLDYHLVLDSRSEKECVLPVSHFSMQGLGIEQKPRELNLGNGCTLAQASQSLIAQIAAQPSAADHDLLWQVFSTWFDASTSVRTKLRAASSSAQLLPEAMQEFWLWKNVLAQTAGDPRLKVAGADRLPGEMAGRTKEGRGLLGKAFVSAFNEIEARCLKNKSMLDACRLRAFIGLAKDAVSVGLCDSIFDWEHLDARVVKLLRCEYRIKTRAITKGSSAFISVGAESKKKGVLNYDPARDTWGGDSEARTDLSLQAGGFAYQDKSGTTKTEATVDRGGCFAQELKIEWILENHAPQSGPDCANYQMALQFDKISLEFDAKGDFDLTLIPKKGPVTNFEDDFWRGPFALAFASYETDSGYLLGTEWSWTEVGERFARWNKNEPFTRGDVSVTIDLYHAPKR